MKIYTKKGDTGETGLLGGVRVHKDHLRIESYGTLDELNSMLGVVLTDAELGDEVSDRIERLQNELFQLGAELACPPGKQSPTELLQKNHVQVLEKEMDEMDAVLAPLTQFILPGGMRAAAELHHARTICRRAERLMVALNREVPLRQEVLQYINRLSDHLFVLARYVNHLRGARELNWNS